MNTQAILPGYPFKVRVVLTDGQGIPLTPTTAQWCVKDAQGSMVQPWTNAPQLAPTMTVDIPAEVNTLDIGQVSRAMLFEMQVDKGLDTELCQHYEYLILNALRHINNQGE